MPSRPVAGLAGFLACAFLIVGLTGLFATYAVPIPLQRALQRDTAIDQAAAALEAPDAAAKLQALAPSLGAQAALLQDPGQPPATRVARARAAAYAELALEADAIATRLRWLIVVLTICATAFGVALLFVAARG
jgi:hypothetical protein